MADILIRGMGNIPVGQEFVIVENIDFERYLYNRETGAAFHLVPLPEGHGRLVDAERFRVILCRLKERQNDDVATHALNWAIECLDKMDTIIPAEGGTDDA